jgi:hypothetical protein
MNNNYRWIFSVLISSFLFFVAIKVYSIYYNSINPLLLSAAAMFCSYIVIAELSTTIYNKIKIPEQTTTPEQKA